MAIKKQEFYEGAALHVLATRGGISGIRYEAPFFILNDRVLVQLKYSTRSRSPWSFTFMPEEQARMGERAAELSIVIGLICGSDGVASFTYEEYLTIAAARETAIHIACYRRHGEHYGVSGPDGILGRKVAPSSWRRLLDG